MTATVVNIFSRRHIEPMPAFEPFWLAPADPWWTCPSWCADCTGGGTYTYDPDRPGSVDGRLHERTIYSTQAAHMLSSEWVTVRVRIERNDFAEDTDPAPADVVLLLGDGAGVRLTRQQRIELAAALLTANEFDAEGAS